MLASQPTRLGDQDRATDRQCARVNGSHPGASSMATGGLGNSGGAWMHENDEDEAEEEEEEEEGSSGPKDNSRAPIAAPSAKRKQAGRPPPIDIGKAREAAGRGDTEVGPVCEVQGASESSSSSSYDTSPSPLSSPQSVCSPGLTSPASLASSSDAADGGILRRKSSIKGVAKTPETPGGKSVRFADALGLDLETVRDILESESPPDYPSMAAAACGLLNSTSDSASALPSSLQPRYLSMSFSQPGGQPDFRTRVAQNCVCLENAVLSDFTVLGTIKVQNTSFHKKVKVRYSADGWRTFGDIPASYVQNSCDGPTDRFSFGLTAPRDLAVGERLEFCVCYTAGNREYWDNNYGKNYTLVCHAQGEVFGSENSLLWTHFM